MKPRQIVALEIASSKVKGAVATVIPGASSNTPASISIDAAAQIDCSNCVQYGRIQNLAEATRIATDIVDTLDDSPIVAPKTICGTYVAIGGRSLMSQSITADINLPQTAEITDEMIRQLKENAKAMVNPDREVLEVIPRRYSVDQTVQVQPVGTLGRRIEGEFTVVTCNPVNKRNLEMVIAERLGIDIVGYITRPLAQALLVLSTEERQIGCMLVDLGAETTTVSIYKNDTLQHLVTLPLGSRNITRDIMNGVNVTEENAEKYKCTIGNADDELRDHNSSRSDEVHINRFVRARSGEIIANILEQLNVAGFKSTDLAAGIIVTGHGAKLKNFNTRLARQSQMNVRVGVSNYDFRFADSNINPTDSTDILSIIYTVAVRTSGDPSCLKEPEKSPNYSEQQEADIIYTEIDIDTDDDDLLLDDDKVDIRRNQRDIKRREEDRKRREEIRRANEKKEKKAMQQALKQQNNLTTDSLDDTEEDDDTNKKTSRFNFIRSIQDRVVKVFSRPEEDAELDDND